MSLLLLFNQAAVSGAPLLGLTLQMDFGTGTYESVSDVIGHLTLEYGIQGNGPGDRIAQSGTLQFSLRNDDGNSAGIAGWYSPQHINCRAWFSLGTRVRIILRAAGIERVKFVGKLAVIDPMPGQYGERVTHCVAHDFMHELMETDVREIAPQIAQTETALLETVLAALPPFGTRPVALDFDPALDVYPFAFDDTEDGVQAITALSRVVESAWGKLLMRGDGTLVYLNRQSGLLQTAKAELNEEMSGLVVASDADQVHDRFRLTAHPKTTSVGTVVLCALPSTEQPILDAGETKEFWMTYRNPASEEQSAGGYDFVAPAAGTDYPVGFNVSADPFAATVKFTVTNTGGVPAPLTNLQLRGRAIYDVAPVTMEAGALTGRVFSADLLYQNDINVLQAITDFVLLERHAAAPVQEVTFWANRSPLLAAYAVQVEPGDLVLLWESMTGLSGVAALVQRVSLELTAGPVPLVECTWGLGPRGSGAPPWLLDDLALSLLDNTTIPGYA